ncbi:MAG: hypothetical protein ABL966_02710 [Acidimicrobiales bacterium]
MMFAAFGSTLYKLLFLGHMIAFVVAFAPAVIHPLLLVRTRDDADASARTRLMGQLARNGRAIHFPALIVLGAFGLGMVFEGDWGFGDAWVSLAFLVWLAMCGVISALMLPSERKLAAGDAAAERMVERAGQLTTLLLLVMLYLMIWKPGA